MEHTIGHKQKRGRNNAGLVVGVLAVGALVVLLALVVIPRLREATMPAVPDYWPTDGWQTSTPEAQGIDSDKLAEATLAWREQGIPIHSLMLIRNGYVVADAAFYPYDGQTIHDVASVTKSVMTTLIGIAVDQGKLSLDDKMVSFFPDRTIANLDEAKQRITVRHLVSMTSGLNCVRDGRPGETNELMQASPDYVQFALDLPVAWEPGSNFVYCSPAIHLLSPILQKATGMTAFDFAQRYLFEPLNIRDATWEQDPQGYYDGWGDLSLYPRDMAKIGLLFQQKGQWAGQQIVSREWVEAATAVQIDSPADEDPYGYGWWLSPDMPGVFRADGRLGQYIIVLPDWELIVVTTGGGFDMEQIGDSLLASFADMENPLPANPEGVARLEATTAAVARPPTPSPVPPLPDVARAISGKTYGFEPNGLRLDRMILTFDDSAEATGRLVADDLTVPLLIGLDDVYRFTTMPDGDGRLVGFRGAWVDPQTFLLEYNGVLSNDQMVFHFHFQDDWVEVTVSEKAGQPGMTFEGRQQAP
jgi:CubicO group peptidase (beta-lactamase class C family)